MGIDALIGNDELFNVQLFKHYTLNKKSFLPYQVLEFNERLKEMEDKIAKV